MKKPSSSLPLSVCVLLFFSYAQGIEHKTALQAKIVNGEMRITQREGYYINAVCKNDTLYIKFTGLNSNMTNANSKVGGYVSLTEESMEIGTEKLPLAANGIRLFCVGKKIGFETGENASIVLEYN